MSHYKAIHLSREHKYIFSKKKRTKKGAIIKNNDSWIQFSVFSFGARVSCTLTHWLTVIGYWGRTEPSLMLSVSPVLTVTSQNVCRNNGKECNVWFDLLFDQLQQKHQVELQVWRNKAYKNFPDFFSTAVDGKKPVRGVYNMRRLKVWTQTQRNAKGSRN